MKFNTAYKTNYPIKFLPRGKRITDTTGYLSPNVRIQAMISAGEKLVQFRDDQAMILDEIYADERALPYNPTELQMLEINSLTSQSAKRALERMQAYQKAQADAEAAEAASNENKTPPDTAGGDKKTVAEQPKTE